MNHDPFLCIRDVQLTSTTRSQLYSLAALEAAGLGRVSRLPVSLRIVLESLLRNVDGHRVTEAHVRELAGWQPVAPRAAEIPFCVARIVLQDFTGVPLLCDLAAMRSVAQRFGKEPKSIEPLVPVDLVIDHSVQVDHYKAANALDLNMRLEFQRNAERYRFIKWGMQAFDNLRVVPPGIGIVHQVNLEFLARGVLHKDGVTYPDSLVGTDSHTTMINALGVVGWGVGGIEAEAGMLGQPLYLLTPDVVGVHINGTLPEGATATDMVLRVTERLRRVGVVGKFVEFFGDGAASLSIPDRATLANMAPEYGATMGFFPVDSQTVNYFGATGRTDEEIEGFESYFKAQGMFGMPRPGDIDYSAIIEFDLGSVQPCVAGPKRPQDRIDLHALGSTFSHLFSTSAAQDGYGRTPQELTFRYPLNAATTPTAVAAVGAIAMERNEIEMADHDHGGAVHAPVDGVVTNDIGHGDVLIGAAVQPRLVIRRHRQVRLVDGQGAAGRCEVVVAGGQARCAADDAAGADTGVGQRGAAARGRAAHDRAGLAVNEAGDGFGEARVGAAVQPRLVIRRHRQVRLVHRPAHGAACRQGVTAVTQADAAAVGQAVWAYIRCHCGCAAPVRYASGRGIGDCRASDCAGVEVVDEIGRTSINAAAARGQPKINE